jgi:hypothetical protein
MYPLLLTDHSSCFVHFFVHIFYGPLIFPRLAKGVTAVVHLLLSESHKEKNVICDM